jgi:hypothetical protein
MQINADENVARTAGNIRIIAVTSGSRELLRSSARPRGKRRPSSFFLLALDARFRGHERERSTRYAARFDLRAPTCEQASAFLLAGVVA